MFGLKKIISYHKTFIFSKLKSVRTPAGTYLDTVTYYQCNLARTQENTQKFLLREIQYGTLLNSAQHHSKHLHPQVLNQKLLPCISRELVCCSAIKNVRLQHGRSKTFEFEGGTNC
jgi:hypothetical protein